MTACHSEFLGSVPGNSSWTTAFIVDYFLLHAHEAKESIDQMREMGCSPKLVTAYDVVTMQHRVFAIFDDRSLVVWKMLREDRA